MHACVTEKYSKYVYIVCNEYNVCTRDLCAHTREGNKNFPTKTLTIRKSQ
jgi:hypothetical protein